MSLDLKEFDLSPRWKLYLEQIDQASERFWANHHTYSYLRLQSVSTWRELRRWLLKVARLLPQKPTAFETFLLHATAYLYEIGWQAPDSPQLSPADRSKRSAWMIRHSKNSATGDSELGLFTLDNMTVEMLAELCVAAADLSIPDISAEPAGYNETVRPRYLAALLQLADLLYVNRVNENIAHSLRSLENMNLNDARLALQPYLALVDLQAGGLKVHLKVHPDDERLASKMNALFEEPLCLWWSANQHWLSSIFGFVFTISPATIDIMHNRVAPPPLRQTCPALIPFLEEFQASCTFSTIEPKPGPEPKPLRTKAFICYSHEDGRLLKELQTHLKPLVREGLEYWDDTSIKPGENWQQKVEHALQETKIAVLLVSPSFMASDFIADNELPQLLAAAKQEGVIILPVILRDSAFQGTDLGQFKAVNDLRRPLQSLTRAEKDRIWKQVAECVRDALKA